MKHSGTDSTANQLAVSFFRPALFMLRAMSTSAPRANSANSSPKGYRVRDPSLIGSIRYSLADAK